MLAEGMEAPTFMLPGVVDSAETTVDLDEYVGEGILVLAFYPADFSPACDGESCDLTELDLFEMQADVDILGISPDSVYSHRAFAEEYDLSMPLLSDTFGMAIDDYDVRLEGHNQVLAKRAVYVIDQNGEIQFTWATEDLEERVDVDAVREAISDIGGDSTALGRYRVGHAHYIEGRRAFTSAMSSYEDRDWLISQGDFERAMEEFQEAADQFESAVRFAESGPLQEGFERAQEKATSLWQAAEWLGDSASAYASGDGRSADDYRQDAETPLENARDIGEPPDPDDIDLDAAAAAAQTAEGDDAPDLQAPSDPAETAPDTGPGGDPDAAGSDDDIDAALEGVEVDEGSDGTGAGSDDEPAVDGVASETGSDDGDEDDEEIELDLKDPTE